MALFYSSGLRHSADPHQGMRASTFGLFRHRAWVVRQTHLESSLGSRGTPLAGLWAVVLRPLGICASPRLFQGCPRRPRRPLESRGVARSRSEGRGAGGPGVCMRLAWRVHAHVSPVHIARRARSGIMRDTGVRDTGDPPWTAACSSDGREVVAQGLLLGCQKGGPGWRSGSLLPPIHRSTAISGTRLSSCSLLLSFCSARQRAPALAMGEPSAGMAAFANLEAQARPGR